MPNAYQPRRRTKIADTFTNAPEPTSEKKVNTTLWIPMNMHKQLKLIAAQNSTTISALMAEAAQHVIDTHQDPQE
ncbi:ribbon-helix-helix domain-containing protein [Brachybacterium huguangmaarense]